MAGGFCHQAAGRAQGQVRIQRYAGHAVQAFHDPRRPHLEADLVAQVDELEGGLEQVVAIGPATDDMQEEIQLARRRPWLRAAEDRPTAGHGPGPEPTGRVQSSMTTLSRTSPWTAENRAGSDRPSVGRNAS